MLNVEYRKVETLIPYARNPRMHAESQITRIAASVVEYGWMNPILAGGDNGIITGHGRLAAVRKLGLGQVPVIELTYLTVAQKRALVIVDNRLALDTGQDEKMLALELAELSDAGHDLALTGFEETEIEALFIGAVAVADDESESEADESNAADDIPEVPVMVVSRPGDVWVIGPHRLTCGDTTDRGVVAALMQSDAARLRFTSLLYGNQRDYTSGGVADWDGLTHGALVHLPMASDGQVLANLGLIHYDNEVISYWDAWPGWVCQQDWRRFVWYIWDQGPGMPSDWAGRFVLNFEFALHFNWESRKLNKIVPYKHAGQESHLCADGSSTTMCGKDGEVDGRAYKGLPTQDTRIPDSAIRVMRHKGKIGQDIDHPAVFPMTLPESVIGAYTDAGDIVFEPLGGSGATMLAAERTGRICCSVKIVPQYVDVTIKWFQQNHLDIPVTSIATGQSFEQVAAGRATTPDTEVVA